jgi:hypothetical protein
VRTTIAVLLFCSAFTVNAMPAETASMTPDALLQRGLSSYRAAHYADAATDLNQAAQALLSQEQMQNYVNTGKFPNLDKFETAIVYLTLAQSKLGHDDQAREAILRLMTAERIEPTYAQLALDADAAGFEVIIARLVPASTLPANAQLARGGSPAPGTTVTTVADAAPTTPATTTAATTTVASATAAPTTVATTTAATTTAVTATAGASMPAARAAEGGAPPKTTSATTRTATAPVTAAPSKPVVTAAATSPTPVQTAQSTIQTDPAERQRYIDEMLAKERTKIEKAAEDRIASERTNIQKAADERIAAERASIQRAADERIALAQKAPVAQSASAQSQSRRTYLITLQEADAYALNNRASRANEIYTELVSSMYAPREIAAEAAVGLYRTGDYRGAANAFRRLAPYGRGEEDLRFYNAVALYETGNYADAKRELACALPYIQVTDDVTRYRNKIERSTSRQAMR